MKQITHHTVNNYKIQIEKFSHGQASCVICNNPSPCPRGFGRSLSLSLTVSVFDSIAYIRTQHRQIIKEKWKEALDITLQRARARVLLRSTKITCTNCIVDDKKKRKRKIISTVQRNSCQKKKKRQKENDTR